MLLQVDCLTAWVIVCVAHLLGMDPFRKPSGGQADNLQPLISICRQVNQVPSGQVENF